ncbi:MAG: threonine ammonia-lyase [Actinobacteria bacterium]|nr:threonine ammonia-lyase [Actinomycetota bacterium]MBI3685850.1 threonine ammonia-lyase [Actinomycetota bacterium]
MELVTFEEVGRARDALAGVARVTPVEGSSVLGALAGGPVWLKCENLQRTGSFKLRGAYVRISRLSAAEKARGVVAASAGNHAQGVALAARLVGVTATVFMPAGAPLPKIEATRGYGAEVHLVGGTVDEALVAADRHAAEHGAVLVHPFDHPDVIAGQGTVGLEIVDQCPEARTIVVAVGGGGLISGIAVAAKAARPDLTVVGVQAEGAAAVPPSLRAGHPVRLDRYATMADGIAVGSPGALTFAHIAALVDEVVTVGEEWLSRALLLCLERAKLVVEPAGAAAVAALLAEPGRFEPPVVAVLSGGNIDPLLLDKVIQHGMAAAGRYLSVRVRVRDRPGELARLLALLADLGANVLDVEHRRTAANLVIGEAEVALSVETRGAEHRAALSSALRAAGYRPFPG